MECDPITFGEQRGAPVLYAAVGGEEATSGLYLVDTATALCTLVGPIGFAVDGMVWEPRTSKLWGVTTAVSSESPCCLIEIDPITGAGTLVGSLGLTSTGADPIGVGDLCLLPDGRLLGLTNSGARGLDLSLTAAGFDRIVVIDKDTGVASLFGSGADFDSNFFFSTDPASIVYDSNLGFLYTMDFSDEIVRVDPVTGERLSSYTHINTDANNKCTSIGPNGKCWVVEYGDPYPDFVSDFSGNPWLGYYATLDDVLAPDPLVNAHPVDPGGFNPNLGNVIGPDGEGADTIIIGTMDVLSIDAIAWGYGAGCDALSFVEESCDPIALSPQV